MTRSSQARHSRASEKFVLHEKITSDASDDGDDESRDEWSYGSRAEFEQITALALSLCIIVVNFLLFFLNEKSLATQKSCHEIEIEIFAQAKLQTENLIFESSTHHCLCKSGWIWLWSNPSTWWFSIYIRIKSGFSHALYYGESYILFMFDKLQVVDESSKLFFDQQTASSCCENIIKTWIGYDVMLKSVTININTQSTPQTKHN